MRAIAAIGRLCTCDWKQIASWALAGPLLFVVYGTGSGTTHVSPWANLIAIGLLLGAFVGVLIQVSRRRSKKNKSLKPIDHKVRNLTERELHVVFSSVGAILGILIARLLWLPTVGYLFCVILLVLLGLSRTKVEQLIP
jgi:uncharacterized protein YacL